MNILSGDIGGTNARLEVSVFNKAKIESVGIRKYKCASFNCLSDIIDVFLSEMNLVKQIDSACLAIAGFVSNGEVEVTNLPWVVSEQRIAEGLNIDKDKVKLINDFEAIGYGIQILDKKKDLITIQKGKKTMTTFVQL